MSYNLRDWILAGWTINELAEKAVKEKLTAQQIIDWCKDHADDDEMRAEVDAMDGEDELADMIAGEVASRIDGLEDALDEMYATAQDEYPRDRASVVTAVAHVASDFLKLSASDLETVARKALAVVGGQAWTGSREDIEYASWTFGSAMAHAMAHILKIDEFLEPKFPPIVTLPALCAAAGYFRFIDTDALLADLRPLPGCSRLTKRTLQRYLYGTGKVPAHVISALSVVLSVPVEVIVKAVTRV